MIMLYTDLSGATSACVEAAVQDPRRYFEQTSVQPPGAVPAHSTADPSDQLSTLEMLKAINPHALQSGMTPAAAKQVPL